MDQGMNAAEIVDDNRNQAENLSVAYIMNVKQAAVNCLIMSGIHSSDTDFAKQSKMEDSVKMYMHDLKLFIKSNFERLMLAVSEAETKFSETVESKDAEDSCPLPESDAPDNCLPQE